MIVHALHILRQELDTFLNSYGPDTNDEVQLGNIAQLDMPEQGPANNLRNKIVISLVNLREEKTLKNGAFSRRNDTTLRTEYFNPSVYLNLYILITASQSSYTNALIYLSRIVAFFQGKNVFTHEDTPAMAAGADVPASELMDEFKLILELYSPSFEEQNHIWGTLGGKQLPSVMYLARLVEVKRAVDTPTGGLIEEIRLNTKVKQR